LGADFTRPTGELIQHGADDAIVAEILLGVQERLTQPVALGRPGLDGAARLLEIADDRIKELAAFS
jgi:hypothetical protein